MPKGSALFALAAAPFVLGVAGCGGDDPVSPPNQVPDVSVASLTITPARITLSGVGETAQLDLIARNAAGDVLSNVAAGWSSDNESVVTVSQLGVVTVMDQGSAVITASVDNVVGSASIDVEFRWSAVAPGSRHACGLWGRRAYCWGAPTIGVEQEVGTEGGSRVPIAVETDLAFVALDAGERHSCALTAEGAMYCWGRNLLGQLGIGSDPEADTPTAVLGNLTFEAMSVGDYHTCGLTSDGTAYCWGGGSVEQDGRDLAVGHQPSDMCARGPYFSQRCTRTPRRVNGGLTFAQISAGLFHTCGVTLSAQAYCWGWNRGMLGNGEEFPTAPDSVPPGYDTPVPVSGTHRFASVSAGQLHSCGIAADGTALCWGAVLGPWNYGQLGTGAFDGTLAPAPVVALTDLVQIDATKENSIYAGNTCAVAQDGSAYCWGTDAEGQVGGPAGEVCTQENQQVSCTSTPVLVDGGLSWATVQTGREFACGATLGGDLYCWGLNTSGQLGNGTTDSSPTPTRVTDPA